MKNKNQIRVKNEFIKCINSEDENQSYYNKNKQLYTLYFLFDI